MRNDPELIKKYHTLAAQAERRFCLTLSDFLKENKPTLIKDFEKIDIFNLLLGTCVSLLTDMSKKILTT